MLTVSAVASDTLTEVVESTLNECTYRQIIKDFEVNHFWLIYILTHKSS